VDCPCVGGTNPKPLRRRIARRGHRYRRARIVFCPNGDRPRCTIPSAVGKKCTRVRSKRTAVGKKRTHVRSDRTAVGKKRTRVRFNRTAVGKKRTRVRFNRTGVGSKPTGNL